MMGLDAHEAKSIAEGVPSIKRAIATVLMGIPELEPSTVYTLNVEVITPFFALDVGTLVAFPAKTGMY
jgi:hypothetical protein